MSPLLSPFSFPFPLLPFLAIRGMGSFPSFPLIVVLIISWMTVWAACRNHWPSGGEPPSSPYSFPLSAATATANTATTKSSSSLFLFNSFSCVLWLPFLFTHSHSSLFSNLINLQCFCAILFIFLFFHITFIFLIVVLKGYSSRYKRFLIAVSLPFRFVISPVVPNYHDPESCCCYILCVFFYVNLL